MPPKKDSTEAHVFSAGEIIFFRHPKQSWVVGTVVSGDPKAGWTCKGNDELRGCAETVDKLKPEEVTSCREDLLDEAPDDLLTLTVLHDATLLRCLYIRYFKDVIYTNIGAIVVALNPFNFKIPWYQDDKIPDYLAEGTVIEKNLPHSWAQAHNTYNEMIASRDNQCILISGESGAGKTEATKIVMKYLARISCMRGTEEEKTASMAVGTKLNACSPILESIGNARTVRNDNSSRFGKFMKVKFADGGQLVGAHTTKYLLEKSRIVTASQENERVYHAFYMAPRGRLAAQLELEPDEKYKSLISGNCLHNSEFDTAEHFDEVCGAMENIGMKKEEMESVWRTVAGILSLLNVSFSAEGEGCTIDAATNRYLDHTVKMWSIEKKILSKELVTTTLTIMGKDIEKPLRPALSVDVRDALAKATYNGMFGWLVEKSNELCDVSSKVGNWIGLLDIFGFEDFVRNSFEQLCINLANETLQNHYNAYIFTKDMDECRAEGIDVTEIKCPDNGPCLQLIVGKTGILALLDEECTLGKGTDLSFLEKVEQSNGKSAFFEKKKTARDTFMIYHYAATVTYDVNGWLEKNRDTLKDNVRLMMRASTDPLVKQFIDAPIPEDEKRGKKLTVGGFFKDQVQLLMEVINSTNPHWIRCVKPHPAKQPKMFDGIQTMNQLESSGVLGTVKIRKAGYPIRTVFEKFNIRYKIIIGDKAKGAKNPRDMSEVILVNVGMKDKKFAQLGKTKVFMKSEAFPLIERKRNEFLMKHAQKLQKCGRGLIERKKVNVARIDFVHQRFAKLMISEYREYMKRSKAIREERARIRREAEEKYRSLRQDVEVQSNQARGKVFDDFLLEQKVMRKELDKIILEAKKREEATREAREAFQRGEYIARMRVFDEANDNIQYLHDLCHQEQQLYLEREMDFIEDRAQHMRDIISEEEKKERNTMWRSFQKTQLAQQLDHMANHEALEFRPVMEALESMQRTEIVERLRLEKKQTIMRSHFIRQKKEDNVNSKDLEVKHVQFDRWKDRELFKLEALRRDEVYRLQLSKSANLHATNNNVWNKIVVDQAGEPKKGTLHDVSEVPSQFPTSPTPIIQAGGFPNTEQFRGQRSPPHTSFAKTQESVREMLYMQQLQKEAAAVHQGGGGGQNQPHLYSAAATTTSGAMGYQDQPTTTASPYQHAMVTSSPQQQFPASLSSPSQILRGMSQGQPQPIPGQYPHHNHTVMTNTAHQTPSAFVQTPGSLPSSWASQVASPPPTTQMGGATMHHVDASQFGQPSNHNYNHPSMGGYQQPQHSMGGAAAQNSSSMLGGVSPSPVYPTDSPDRLLSSSSPQSMGRHKRW